MIEFLKRILVFGVIGSVLYLLSLVTFVVTGVGKYIPGIVVKTEGTGFQANRNLESKGITGRLDIAFMGSSEVFTGFNTQTFRNHGFNAFNYGSNAQTPSNTLFVYEKYVRSRHPEYLVFDVYWKVFEIDGMEAFIDVTTNDSLSIHDVSYGIAQHTSPVLLNSVLYSWSKQQLVHVYPTPISNKKNVRYFSGGYVENTSYQHEDLQAIEPHNIVCDEKQVKAFDSFLKLCKHDGVKVILVKTPVTEEYYQSVKNKSDFFHKVQSISENYGFPFVDFNNISLNSQTDFIDKNHLSSRGVKKFNDEFLRWFSKYANGTKN